MVDGVRTLHIEIRRRTIKPGWFQRAMDLFKHKKLVVKAGFPVGSASADNIMKAIWNEFGTRGGAAGGGWGGPIPERPFLRTAIRKNQVKYHDALRISAAKILAGDMDTRTPLEKLGILIVSDIQAQITSNMPPPNSPLTIALKGSSRTLIDTGAMRAAVTYKVDVQR